MGDKWWESEKLPFKTPGGRGWLARVVVEGTVCPGDEVTVVLDEAARGCGA